MIGSLRLGRLFGIPVYMHFTFILLLAVVALVQLFQGGIAAAFAMVLLISAVFGCVLLHEFGHALAARHFGIATRDVTLLPIGGLARLERLPSDPRQELWIALAGPAVNVVLVGFFAVPAVLFGSAVAAQLMMINLGLVLFNMLPAFPMDGGRVLRAVLAGSLGNLRATEIAAAVGRVMAVIFGVAGLLWNPMLIFIAMFVWFGAGQEARLARRQHEDRFAAGRTGAAGYAWVVENRDGRIY
jgi:Zn-dependent protease